MKTISDKQKKRSTTKGVEREKDALKKALRTFTTMQDLPDKQEAEKLRRIVEENFGDQEQTL
ncbi:MAG: hypothetical protein Q4F21_00785 [Lachnospiraceae bacterium]|nr:hypothetical protein [Lachnospiraceae bacterium]